MSVTSIVQEQPIAFDDWWSIYPRHEAKKDAARAWNKLTPTQQRTAMAVTPRWRKIFIDRGVEFTPHGATWLNGWRFDDELPSTHKSTHASHVPIVPAKVEESHGPMPDFVLALAAKMRMKK